MTTLLSTYYTKSIRLTPNGFSLYKRNENGELESVSHLTTDNILLAGEVTRFFGLQDAGQTLEVVVATHTPMLIPDIIYKEERAHDYLQMQYDIAQIGRHFSDTLGRYRSLYFLTQQVWQTLQTLPCTLNFRSEGTLMYDFLLKQGKSECVLISMNNTFADVITLHANEPALVNRLTHIEPVDVLYYLLNCMQQFALSTPTLFVHYFGKPNKKLSELLKQYHNDVIIL